MSFSVIAGEYEDTRYFGLMSRCKVIESLGPFEEYDDAIPAWRALSWKYVDNCMIWVDIHEVKSNG